MRIAPANANGTVDLNNIPVALLDRLDVLTGGASTTYGADAVSGVVNFITKRNFAGVSLQVGESITGKGDGNSLRADLVVGANFDDGRGNAVLGIGYIETDPIYQGDRTFSNFGIGLRNGRTSGASGTSVPTTFAFATGNVQINPTSTALVPAYNPFNFNPYNIFQTPFRRYNMFAKANYEISDSVEVYTRALFSKNTTQSIIAPSGIFGNDLTINPTNPYLTGTIRDQICAANGFTVLATCLAQPSISLGGVYRRSVELGPRISTYVTNIFDYMAGVRYNISDSIRLDVRGNYGESENVSTQSGYVANSRVQQALFATNTTTCTNASNGCVPLNIFGQGGSINAAQAGFIGGLTSSVTDKTTLSQAQAVLTGDFGYTIGSANAPVSFAAGGEYRKYSNARIPDNLAQVPGELGGAGGATLPFAGGYDVYEAFGELIVPIASNQPFFDELSVEGGVRYSKYRVEFAGNPSSTATTYKAGINWAPVSALKLRANYQRAVRAPNLFELFSPNATGLTSLVTDPCAGAAPVGNANLTAVCIAQGAPAASIGNIPQPSAGQANATAGGNPFLKPEKADTFTVGAVIKGEGFLPGFTASVDYYRIVVNNAITTATSGDVIANCFTGLNAASATSAACTGIRRSNTNGALSGTSTPTNPTQGLPTPYTNAGRLFTDGIDLTLNYRHEFDIFGGMTFNYNFAGNWTNRAQFQASRTGFNRECVGFYSSNCSSQNGAIQPKYSWTQRTTFGFGDVDLSLLWRHISSVKYEATAADYVARGFNKGTVAAPVPDLLFAGQITDGAGIVSGLAGRTVDFNKIPAYDYFDLSARFSLTKELQLTLTAFNVFDRQPPIVPTGAGTSSQSSGNTFPSSYDALGRKFSATVALRF
jgi:iron complex outermembrane recepter protein